MAVAERMVGGDLPELHLLCGKLPEHKHSHSAASPETEAHNCSRGGTPMARQVTSSGWAEARTFAMAGTCSSSGGLTHGVAVAERMVGGDLPRVALCGKQPNHKHSH